MNAFIRLTTPDDYAVTEMVTREAFWNVYGPGCDEHYLLHVMRGSDGFIPELDFVAVIGDTIVGNSVGDKSVIRTDDGEEVEVITLGPISVLPEYQNMGIGAKLIEQAKNAAHEMGFRSILLYGDPLYYSKFGFRPAETYDIRSGDDMYAEPLQVFELYPGSLTGITGRYFENDVYEVDDAAVAEFDKKFPPKQTQEGTKSQKRFQYLLNSRTPRFT
jgi:predicted N-acetyltransferase YhbS